MPVPPRALIRRRRRSRRLAAPLLRLGSLLSLFNYVVDAAVVGEVLFEDGLGALPVVLRLAGREEVTVDLVRVPQAVLGFPGLI